MHLYGCLGRDQFLPFGKTSQKSETAEIFVFLGSIVINLSMRIFDSELPVYIKTMLIFSFICEETSEFYSRVCFVTLGTRIFSRTWRTEIRRFASLRFAGHNRDMTESRNCARKTSGTQGSVLLSLN